MTIAEVLECAISHYSDIPPLVASDSGTYKPKAKAKSKSKFKPKPFPNDKVFQSMLKEAFGDINA